MDDKKFRAAIASIELAQDNQHLAKIIDELDLYALASVEDGKPTTTETMLLGESLPEDQSKEILSVVVKTTESLTKPVMFFLNELHEVKDEPEPRIQGSIK